MARSRYATPIVGRERELSVLAAAMAAAALGDPTAVLISGDAGVGKTRLLAEFADRAAADAATVLVGHCLDVGGVGLPYLPFTEALQPLRRDRPGGPETRDWDAQWRAEAKGADVGQLQLFDAVVGALAEAGAGSAGPVVLVLEDLHWADQSTRDLLAFLLARMREERLLVVASYRSDDLHRRHPLRGLLAELVRLRGVERLDLAAFDAKDMAAYLRALRGGPVPERTVQEILGRSEGNAYYAQELLAAWSAAPAAETDAALPQGLVDVLLARVESLSSPVQHIARVASVAGRRVSHELLRQVSGMSGDDLEAGLRESVRGQVLMPDGRDAYAFRHALLQEAVYGDLLPGERARLHAAYACAVEEAVDGPTPLGSAATLAHHRMESHDVPGALASSVRAAREAEQLHAPAEAQQQLERALQLWDAVPDAEQRTGTDLVRLSLWAAALASRAGELARAAALARDAVERVDSEAQPQLAASAKHQLADHLLGIDQMTEALSAARDAIRLDGPPDQAGPAGVRGAAAAARALLSMERTRGVRSLAEQARQGAIRLGDAGAEADALVSLARLDDFVGRPRGAQALFAQAVERAREAGDLPTELRASYNLAAERYDRGELQPAMQMLEAATARCEANGLTWSPFGLELRALLVTALYVTGDWDRSLRAARMAGARPPDAAAARLSAAALYAAVARGDEAAPATVRQLEGAWHHDPHIALVAGGCGADLLRYTDEPAAAIEVAERALRYVDDIWQVWYLAGIWLAAQGIGAAGDLAERARLSRDEVVERAAREAGDRLLERARTTAREGRPRGGTLGPEGRAWLARAEAEHTRVIGAPDPIRWEQARDAYAYGNAYEQARCRLRLAEALLGVDRRDEAAAEARAAHETAVRLGALPLRQALEALARRGRLDVGIPPAPRSAAPGDAVALTAREQEVLALLADGATNRQIGQRLFIAEKTASVHVSNILAKLGASGRTEAVNLAHQRGLLSAAARLPH